MRYPRSFGFLLIAGLALGCAPGTTPEPATGATQPAVASEAAPQETRANALARESSPYLLMHAHNPVDWHPWNEASLARAKQLGKPIFLSIGYSSCHWCHVMERESFLDPEIAKFLNAHFFCIKVDREERPDVDEIYMHALLAIRGGGGGWPLSMFLTPEAKPFFGGTYWPARDGDRGASMGFLTILKRVEELFRLQRERLEEDAQRVTVRTRELLAGEPAEPGLPLQKSWVPTALEALAAAYDPQWGGFRYSPTNPEVPKFPEPSNLLFLLQVAPRDFGQETLQGETSPRQMLIKTCQQMAQGGIYDHLGGGFHRYSVDRYWRIPHFEKMLYDNGQLASVYAEAYQLTGRETFRDVVKGILTFVDRELKSPEGAFYSSLDAESEGEEGKYYRWSREEIQQILGSDYPQFAEIYGIDQEPNFEGQFYAPQLSQEWQAWATARALSTADLQQQLQPLRDRLLAARDQRVRPLLDHKILTAWNGLMIRGYADAGRILKDASYVDTAATAAQFALERLVSPEGRVFRAMTDGEVRLNGYLIDYACLIDGLIALHRASGEERWLAAAARLQETQDELFWDSQGGGYFYTSRDHEVLIARSKPFYDGAMPSGNSVAAGNLWYLAQQLDRPQWRQRAQETVQAASPVLTRSGTSLSRMLLTVDALLESSSATAAQETPQRPAP